LLQGTKIYFIFYYFHFFVLFSILLGKSLPVFIIFTTNLFKIGLVIVQDIPHGTIFSHDMNDYTPKCGSFCLTLCALFLFSFPLSANTEELWWKRFNDHTLDSLMEEAVTYNLDIRMAQDRILQARAAYRASLGAFYPDFTLAAGWQRDRESRHMTSILSPATYESYYSGQIKTSLTLDIFGHLRKEAEARKAAYRASRAERDVALLTLCKEVASTYYSLCTTRRLIEVLNSNIATQSEIARITEARYEAGLESKLDVTQALSTLYNTQAGITTYKSDEIAYISQLAVLLGAAPRLFGEHLQITDTLPDIAYLIPDTIGMATLRDRPDLRQAEWLIDEQAAELGVARKAWLPTFLINGYIGLLSHELDDLLNHHSYAWQIEPVMQWTIFDGGQRTQNIRQQRAALQEQVDHYNQLLLTAMHQVESSVMAYRQSLEQVAALSRAVEQAQASLQLSMELYKMGLTSFINVVQAQQSVLQYQTAWVTASNKALQNLITFYTAISPGFTE